MRSTSSATPAMKIGVKGCPDCQGYTRLEHDVNGKFLYCINCGRESPLQTPPPLPSRQAPNATGGRPPQHQKSQRRKRAA